MNEEGARACLLDPIRNIDGHQLHCRLAILERESNVSGATATSAPAAAPLAPTAAAALLAPAAAAPFAPAAATAVPLLPAATTLAPAAAPWGFSRHSMNLNPCSVSGQFSYSINGSGVAAPLAATGAQVRGSVDGFKLEVVNSNHQSSMDGSFELQFDGRGPSGISAYGGNLGGLLVHSVMVVEYKDRLWGIHKIL